MSTPSWAGPLAWSIALGAGLYVFQPPSIPDAPGADEFNTARASELLARIAAAPHPTGSIENAAVRELIIAQFAELSLQTEVRSDGVVVPWRAGQVRGARVENLLTRIPGQDSTGTILLAAHYDSVPTGPGAGDDSVAVAAMLEVARHLTQQPVRNDVLMLLTDGEETGLMGARAFVRDEELLSEITAVVNFEARGGGGPALLFETSDDNAWLISDFAAAPNASGNSMAYEVYRRMPNDTDFSVFRAAGLSGLNFGFVDRFPHYHTALDTFERLDLRSLQHHGENMLTLARRLGERDFSAPQPAGNSVFFSVPGVLVRYPSTLSLPLALLALILAGARSRKSAIGGLLLSVLAVGLSGALGLVLSSLLQAYHPGMSAIAHPTMYEDVTWRVFIAAMAVLVVAGLRAAALRWVDVEGMWAGGRLLWALLAVGIALEAPGASYLFVWPLLAAAVAPLRWAGVAGGAAVFFLIPIGDQLLIALGLHGAMVAGVVYGLAVLLMVVERPRMLAAVAAAVALMAGILGSIPSSSDADSPRHSGLVYLQQDGEAVWLATEQAAWTQSLLTDPKVRFEDGTRNPLIRGEVLESVAENRALTRPIVRTRSTITTADQRWLRGTFYGKRDGCMLVVRIDDTSQVVELQIDGQPIPITSSSLTMAYFAPLRSGVPISVQVTGEEPVPVYLSEQTFTLPAGVERSASSIPSPFGMQMTDSSIVTIKVSI